MSELPENRKPLLWKDMPFADRPKGHPSTERLEIQKLQERVAKLEAALLDICEISADGYGSEYVVCYPCVEIHVKAHAALKQENK